MDVDDESSTIYQVWVARNKRVFEQEVQDAEVTLAKCVYAIKYRVNSWRGIARNRDNWRICIDWGLDLAIFDK
ncbi:hypothetical protein LIER_18222 [Lithospermum erythrorhizon]|uniref:Uncharacterized protein n=1 Tax=Lithospermum erythrorhizon TaxID=34254 RepID=A0AAV3QD48_LITER